MRMSKVPAGFWSWFIDHSDRISDSLSDKIFKAIKKM